MMYNYNHNVLINPILSLKYSKEKLMNGKHHCKNDKYNI
ncbi:UNVERIFIED_CONTAM: hypothetical protein Cloal_2351 [Acetivibrio alkalicellulosi]